MFFGAHAQCLHAGCGNRAFTSAMPSVLMQCLVACRNLKSVPLAGAQAMLHDMGPEALACVL